MNNRRLHGIPHAHRVWGGGSVALLLKFLGAFRAGVRCAAEKKPERPWAPVPSKRLETLGEAHRPH